MSPISSSTAKRVRKVLETVIKSGTGTAAAVDGVTVAGKTGTAETGKEKDNSWFVGMGPSDDADVVIAIVCEESDEGTATVADGSASNRPSGIRYMLAMECSKPAATKGPSAS